MVHSKVYTMQERTFHKMNGDITCYTCNQKIKINDEVHSTIRPKGRIMRHLACAKRINLV